LATKSAKKRGDVVKNKSYSGYFNSLLTIDDLESKSEIIQREIERAKIIKQEALQIKEEAEVSKRIAEGKVKAVNDYFEKKQNFLKEKEAKINKLAEEKSVVVVENKNGEIIVAQQRNLDF